MITGHLIGVTVDKGFDCTQKSCSGVCLVKKSMVEDCLVHMEWEGGGMEGGEGAVECITDKWGLIQIQLITFVDWGKIGTFGLV